MITVDFSGKTVLVTGGSSGIGNGIATTFRAAGAEVVVTGTGTRESYDSDLAGMRFHQLDIADDGAVEALGRQIESLDVLVNSVGTVAYKRQEYEMPAWRRVLEVNLTGVMHCCQVFQPKLAAAKGNVVNIASVASFRATPGNPAYSASKGGLATLTMSLAVAWGRFGIRVNGVAPGFVDTKLTRITRDNPELYAKSLERVPLRRWGEPTEMGTAALFLASPLASYITGVTLPVDGGQMLI